MFDGATCAAHSSVTSTPPLTYDLLNEICRKIKPLPPRICRREDGKVSWIVVDGCLYATESFMKALKERVPQTTEADIPTIVGLAMIAVDQASLEKIAAAFTVPTNTFEEQFDVPAK
jgi:hypothetical protein